MAKSAFIVNPKNKETLHLRSVLLILNFTIDYAPFLPQNRIFNIEGRNNVSNLMVLFYCCVWYTLR